MMTAEQVGNYLILKEHSICHVLNCTYFSILYDSSLIGWPPLVVFINTFIRNLHLPFIYTCTIYFYYFSALVNQSLNYEGAKKISLQFLFQSASINLILIHLSQFSYFFFLDRSRTPTPKLWHNSTIHIICNFFSEKISNLMKDSGKVSVDNLDLNHRLV